MRNVAASRPAIENPTSWMCGILRKTSVNLKKFCVGLNSNKSQIYFKPYIFNRLDKWTNKLIRSFTVIKQCNLFCHSVPLSTVTTVYLNTSAASSTTSTTTLVLGHKRAGGNHLGNCYFRAYQTHCPRMRTFALQWSSHGVYATASAQMYCVSQSQ